MIIRIENAIEHMDIVLGAFLDSENTFGRTTFAAERYGTELAICRWICSMLKSRQIMATVSEEFLRSAVANGCPLGGMLSPPL